MLNFRLIWKYRRTSCHFDLLTKSQGSFSHQLHAYFFEKVWTWFFQFVQKCNNFCSRFLLTIGCPMAFHNYPMDLQECNLKLQSCKYVPVSFCNLFKNGIKLQSPPSLASPYSLSKFEQIAILFGSYLILLLYQKVFQSSVTNYTQN